MDQQQQRLAARRYSEQMSEVRLRTQRASQCAQLAIRMNAFANMRPGLVNLVGKSLQQRFEASDEGKRLVAEGAIDLQITPVDFRNVLVADMMPCVDQCSRPSFVDGQYCKAIGRFSPFVSPLVRQYIVVLLKMMDGSYGRDQPRGVGRNTRIEQDGRR